MHIQTTMILRRALGATSPWAARSSPRPLRRFISTQVESTESSAQSSLKQLQSTHAQLNAEGDQSIAAVDTETHGTFASATASVAEEYHHFKQLGKSSTAHCSAIC